jgi:hypothetical protein
MKKLISVFLFCFLYTIVFAQANSDSLAYQLQRKKINAMLAQRTAKFGQYEQSLSMHTGIFGLQTKKDIRNSNEILIDIVKTDDDIYKELKILLEYRTFQQTQVVTHSREAEDSNIGFMTAINKLRSQIDKLKADAEQQRQQQGKTKQWAIILFILMLTSILYLAFRRSKRST